MIQIRLKMVENEQPLREFFIDSYRRRILTDCVIYCHCLNDSNHNDDENNKTINYDPSSTETLNLNQEEKFEITHNEKYQEFHCHRLILSTYSTFFRHYFCHHNDSNQSQRSTSIFIDLSASIMADLLKIIYYGSITIVDEERKNEIMAAAMKLGVSDNLIIGGDQIKIENQESINKSLIDHQSSSTKMMIGNHFLKKRLLTNDNDSEDDQDHHHHHHQGTSMNNKYYKFDSSSIVGPSIHNRKQQLNPSIVPSSIKTTTTTMMPTVSMPMITNTIMSTNKNNNNSGNNTNSNQTKRIGDKTTTSVATVTTTNDTTTTTTTTMYICQHCQKQYNYEISLKKHIKSAH
ncbi:uncharacterized protein LOC124500601 isoform X2 [Dermatophagoides farinae]|uniref:BTB domain-containing protein n=1 Tax=Dermatophagoides farinae TaxID=6954 RepID=A0A922I932_DERFA|nr:homeobox protein 10-like isoform X2 [Dermatophagoides farinae]KAH9521643.1 hypothetical protein DERF_005279 [Dermatophagoides farinae]